MFKLVKIENGRMNVPPPEFYEVTTEEEVKIGEALVLSAGKLTKCSGTTMPTHIAMSALGASATKRDIPVARIESNQVYDVAVSAVPIALVPGNKVTIDTDGMRVTATTTDGVATIISTNGAKKIGDIITVRF